MSKGFVSKILIAPSAGAPMIEVESVRALVGLGLEGDRYAAGVGSFSKSARIAPREVSIISEELFKKANKELSDPLTVFELRRNIVISGVSISALKKKKIFNIGDVFMEYAEICDPCKRPPLLLRRNTKDQLAFMYAYRGIRAGIRVIVKTPGIISQGDPVF